VTYRGGVGKLGWFRRHPVGTDVVVAVFFVLLDTVDTLVGGSWWPTHPGTLAWVLLGLQAAACASVVVRRRAPLVAVTILAGFTLALSLLIDPAGLITPASPWAVWAPYATTLVAYSPLSCAGTRENRRTAFIAIGLLTIVVARPWQPSLTIIAVALLRTAAGPLLVLYFDARRRLVQALTERAERAERERHLLAEQARAEERTRLAGEMHDVVTHRVSLMVLQAGALRMTAPDEVTRTAAEELRAAGCQALDELRDLVGILRTAPEDAPDGAVDGAGSASAGGAGAAKGLATLIAESTAVGTPAELVETGNPALASPVVGRTAYRIVREALTNVRKHAPGAWVTVHVDYRDDGVRLSVRNTPPARVPAAAALDSSALASTGSGLGISSLRQRIELVRGTLHTGHSPDGGFCLEATLPAYVPTAESVG
jgi:signal transduction histidine kinase